MSKTNHFPIQKFENIQTPFYYYDLEVLRKTIDEVCRHAEAHNFHIHYALKANNNPAVLKEVKNAGFGADCVSGGEVQLAIDSGISPDKIVFAGVGKIDWEINLGLDHNIFCFNVESMPELEIINELAGKKNKIAQVALRINPNVNAHTHHYITTGLTENKFGINISELDSVLELFPSLPNVKLVGIHFHIGSQITDMTSFQGLCVRINEIQDYFDNRRITLNHINVGGGLGIDYEHPNHFPISDFDTYFNIFRTKLKLRPHQTLHFELGRSIVGQCGSLISRVLYIKQGTTKQFAILDAGFNDLIRPTLYQAYHRIENLTSNEPEEKYDVVGPVCESADVFAKSCSLNKTKRGDIIALRSAGAYGETMASQYNMRKLPKAYTSDDF